MGKTHTGSLDGVNGDSDKEMTLSRSFQDEPVTNGNCVGNVEWGDGVVGRAPAV